VTQEAFSAHVGQLATSQLPDEAFWAGVAKLIEATPLAVAVDHEPELEEDPELEDDPEDDA